MKLVIEIHCSDDCTYSYTQTEPVEYKSEEQFLVDFEEWAEKNKGKTFIFCGEGFAGTNLQPDSEWDIYTLEDWFENNKPQQ